MSKFKIVFVDDVMPITDVEKDIIHGFGCEITQHSAFTTEEILSVAADADAIITVSGKFNRATIEGLKNCKVISRFGQGFDNVDVKAATEKGIVVTYVPIYCREEVATLALTLMLACERRLLIADKTVKGGHWVNAAKSVAGARSVSAKTLGLIGLGSIQKQLVSYLKPFGAKIVAYDPYINREFCAANGIEPVEKDELLKMSDTVFLQVPLMESTFHMIAEKELAEMKDGAILINTGRGALVDQLALTEALKSGKLAAAGLDVLEFEPPRGDEEIFRMDNVITSGHIGAATAEALIRLRTAVAQNVVDVLSGKKPTLDYAGIANPDVLKNVTLA